MEKGRRKGLRAALEGADRHHIASIAHHFLARKDEEEPDPRFRLGVAAWGQGLPSPFIAARLVGTLAAWPDEWVSVGLAEPAGVTRSAFAYLPAVDFSPPLSDGVRLFSPSSGKTGRAPAPDGFRVVVEHFGPVGESVLQAWEGLAAAGMGSGPGCTHLVWCLDSRDLGSRSAALRMGRLVRALGAVGIGLVACREGFLPGPGGRAAATGPVPGSEGGPQGGRRASWRALASAVAPGIPTCEVHVGGDGAGSPSTVVDGLLAGLLRNLVPWPSR